MSQSSSTGGVSPARTDGIVKAFSHVIARRAHDAIVVSTSRRATFGEVDALARAVQHQIAPSIEPGALVGLAAPNGPAFLAGFLALRRGAHTALLLEPLAPPADTRRAATAMGATAVLECANPWPTSAADFRLSRARTSAAPRTLPGIAVIKLTSGSTGVPRGVAIRAEHLMADEAALARTMGLLDTDRLLVAMPLSHRYGFTTLALSALVRGLTLVLPDDHGPFAPLAAARSFEATVFPTVPAYVHAVLKTVRRSGWPSSIRLVISAGAVMASETAVRFRQTYGQPVHAFYGSSECGGICYDREGSAAERGTVGTPVEGVRITLKEVEGAGAGEGLVVVESKSVGDTYVPEPDPRLGGGRFDTCDVGVWSQGELVLLRRADRVINVRGRKVDPLEVEHVLAVLEGVAEAVVIGVASPDGRDEIVRAVIACPSGRLNYQDVATWCRQRLAEHKVPRSVVIVDAIPRTPRGKIDRSRLLELRTADESPGVAHE